MPEQKERRALRSCLKAVEVYAADAEENGTGLGAADACKRVRDIVCRALELKKRKLDEMDTSAIDW